MIHQTGINQSIALAGRQTLLTRPQIQCIAGWHRGRSIDGRCSKGCPWCSRQSLHPPSVVNIDAAAPKHTAHSHVLPLMQGENIACRYRHSNAVPAIRQREKNISFLGLARSSAKQLQPLAKCSLVSAASLPAAGQSQAPCWNAAGLLGCSARRHPPARPRTG